MIVILVVSTIIVTAAITVPLTVLVTRRPRPVMSYPQRVLLVEAMTLLHQLLHPTSLSDLDDLDSLSGRSRQEAKRLLNRYEKESDK